MKYLLFVFTVVLCFTANVYGSLPSSEPTLETEAELQFLELAWAEEIFGYGDYAANEEGIFQRGTRAYVYMEIAGFESRYSEEEGQYFTDVVIDVELRSRIGLRLFREQEIVTYSHWDATEPGSLWFYIWVDIPAWTPRSTYTASVTIRDKISERTLIEEQDLLVE